MKKKRRLGETYKGFRYTKIEPVEELNCTLVELVQERVGSKVMYIEAKDKENLFCLSFQTLPSSDNGAAHILEHTVLCGSKRFPVKDPFFSMSRRSLNTFMNALTGSDFTCYPASSQIEKDLYNLLDVYLDAVFDPLLTKESFLQEGHRLEFLDPKDPASPLLFKGVVYNEMKGSLSSPETRLWHGMMDALVPDLPYRFNSGGDPKEIPNLTHEDLIAFHKKYYHPSRCLFFFYGDIPIEKHIDFIEKKLPFKKLKKAPPLPEIPLQKRFPRPSQRQMFYAAHPEQHLKTFISFGWLTTTLVDQEDLYGLMLLDSILMDTDASLLRRRLLASNLCVQAGGMMDVEMTEVPYAIVCRGCEEKNAEKLKKVLFDSLEEIAKAGIEEKYVLSSLHQMEVQRREIGGGQSPYGLVLFFRSGLAAQHGALPEDALCVKKHFKRLLLACKDPHYLSSLIRRYLLDNPHFVQITMSPDFELEKKEQQAELSHLEEIAKKLTDKQKREIVKQAEKLEEHQKKSEQQSLKCLPKILTKDIPKKVKDFALVKRKKDFGTLFHHEVFTNDFLYMDYVLDLPFIEKKDLPFVQLLVALMPHLGMGPRSYSGNLEFMHAHIGSLGIHLDLHAQMGKPGKMKPALSCKLKGLFRNRFHLFELLRDLLHKGRLDESGRIKELLQQMAAQMKAGMFKNPLGQAIQLSLASYSLHSTILYHWQGLKYYEFIMDLVDHIDDKLPYLMEKLKEMQEKIFHLNKPDLIISSSLEAIETMEKEDIFHGIYLPSKPFVPWKSSYEKEHIDSQAKPLPIPVAFTSLGLNTIKMPSKEVPAICLATHLFDNLVLHKKIREQGGAYGSGTGYNPLTGNFYFYGYRDPHIASTVGAFTEAVETISAGKFAQQDLEESKIEIMQNLDSPINPGSRGSVAYNWMRSGQTRASREKFRKDLLHTTKVEIKEAVKKHLRQMLEKATLITFASPDLIEKENPSLEKIWKRVHTIPL